MQLMASFQDGFSLELVMKPNCLKHKRWFCCLSRDIVIKSTEQGILQKNRVFFFPPKVKNPEESKW